ncbi:MAG: TIGR04283 family arsenosugar biosynthesis glycosyltransferase [Calditrichia bacterium]
MSRISIIVPVLNERENLIELIPYLRSLSPESEIIVVDAGSLDSPEEVLPAEVKLIRSPKGRAVQMNKGAAIASGDVLWFLHADCRPHPDSFRAIETTLQTPRIIGGAFEYRHDGEAWYYRISAFFSNRKNRLLKTIYGDMGIFIRRDIFFRIGGYPEVALMEDMEICRKMKKEGRIIILPQLMKTSARRWEKEGVLKNIFRNWILQILWFCGVSPDYLAQFYHFE